MVDLLVLNLLNLKYFDKSLKLLILFKFII